jgi:hypothetical protein
LFSQRAFRAERTYLRGISHIRMSAQDRIDLLERL